MDISKWAFQNRNLVYFLVAVLLWEVFIPAMR